MKRILTEVEASEILKEYSISVPACTAATSEKEAVEFAGKAGYPVVLKLASLDAKVRKIRVASSISEVL